MGIHFKQDFCKADREARAAAWPKMEQARAAGQNVYYRGHAGYINGNSGLDRAWTKPCHLPLALTDY